MQLGGKRGCGNEREDLGKLFDPRWGLQGGSESFPDPPGCRVGCSGADGGGKGERERGWGLHGEGKWDGRDGCLTATDKSQRAPV